MSIDSLMPALMAQKLDDQTAPAKAGAPGRKAALQTNKALQKKSFFKFEDEDEKAKKGKLRLGRNKSSIQMVLTVADKVGSIQSSQGSNVSLSSQKGATPLGNAKTFQTFETVPRDHENRKNKALQNEPSLMMTPT